MHQIDIGCSHDTEIQHRQIVEARFKTASTGHRTVAMITHNREGGVLHHVQARSSLYRQAGKFVIVIRPGSNSNSCEVSALIDDVPLTTTFVLRDEGIGIRSFLLSLAIEFVEVHHFIGYNGSIFDFIRNLAVPYDVFVHDYSWFCPRITLTAESHRYCGEPNVSECVKCIDRNGIEIDESITVRQLRKRSEVFFGNARSIIAPSKDTSKRIQNQMGFDCIVQPWDLIRPKDRLKSSSAKSTKKKVCVVGAISYEKGYYILLEMALIIKNFKLPMELVIVGFTCDDPSLLRTGSVVITGRYQEEQVVDLIREQYADIGFLPALWPETWSYTLSHMWSAGLFVVAYDIGAPAERIRMHHGGTIIPLHLPISRLLSLFLEHQNN